MAASAAHHDSSTNESLDHGISTKLCLACVSAMDWARWLLELSKLNGAATKRECFKSIEKALALTFDRLHASL